ALALLYPTKPVSDTIYTAGQAAYVKWIEDGRRPLLKDMGKMRMDLYARNSTYLATLVKDLDPRSLSTTVYIPLVIPTNLHLYTLRFVSPKPPYVIYTADFSIIPNPLSLQAVFPTPSSRTTLPSTPSTSSTFLSRISTLSADAAAPSSTTDGGKTNSAGLGRWRWDAERMKFRLVFIVWPALVGLSLA
ncbi:hypothetical protein B0H34DRAFT_619932, partial [Crassisporium funariophilum]